jgi:hypothetical protein
MRKMPDKCPLTAVKRGPLVREEEIKMADNF